MSNDADPLDLAAQNLSRAALESDALQRLSEPERAAVARRLSQPINPLWLLAPDPVKGALDGNWDHRLLSAAPLPSEERAFLAGSIARLLSSGGREAALAAIVAHVRDDGADLDGEG